jgi:hypothetical protein
VIVEKLSIDEYKERPLMMQCCSAKTTDGVWEGMNLLGDLFDEMRANKV